MENIEFSCLRKESVWERHPDGRAFWSTKAFASRAALCGKQRLRLEILFESHTKSAYALFGVDEFGAGVLKGTPDINQCAIVRLSRTSFEINDRAHRKPFAISTSPPTMRQTKLLGSPSLKTTPPVA